MTGVRPASTGSRQRCDFSRLAEHSPATAGAQPPLNGWPLLWTSPKYANEACSSQFVQIDHRDPWANTHHARIDKLDHLCPHDHRLKTYEGWSLVAGTERRAFVAARRPPPPP